MAEKLDGKVLAESILVEAESRLGQFVTRAELFVVDFYNTNDPVQEKFVTVKEQAFLSIGLGFVREKFSLDASVTLVADRIRQYATNPSCVGIIVQLPLPQTFSQDLLENIPAAKDIDVLTRYSKAQFYNAAGIFLPPTAHAVAKLIKQVPGYSTAWTCFVLGQGELVGRPVATLLRQMGHEVAVADEHTPNPRALASSCKVLVSGIGKPKFVTSDWVGAGAVVVDAGTSDVHGRLTGDVDESVWAKASFVTPSPGGVGPVTVACLVENAVVAVIDQTGKK